MFQFLHCNVGGPVTRRDPKLINRKLSLPATTGQACSLLIKCAFYWPNSPTPSLTHSHKGANTHIHITLFFILTYHENTPWHDRFKDLNKQYFLNGLERSRKFYEICAEKKPQQRVKSSAREKKHTPVSVSLELPLPSLDFSFGPTTIKKKKKGSMSISVSLEVCILGIQLWISCIYSKQCNDLVLILDIVNQLER